MPVAAYKPLTVSCDCSPRDEADCETAFRAGLVNLPSPSHLILCVADAAAAAATLRTCLASLTEPSDGLTSPGCCNQWLAAYTGKVYTHWMGEQLRMRAVYRNKPTAVCLHVQPAGEHGGCQMFADSAGEFSPHVH